MLGLLAVNLYFEFARLKARYQRRVFRVDANIAHNGWRENRVDAAGKISDSALTISSCMVMAYTSSAF